MSDLISVSVSGRDIYEWLAMPVVPRKGDILWLSSLTRGHSDVVEVVVSKGGVWAVTMDSALASFAAWMMAAALTSHSSAGADGVNLCQPRVPTVLFSAAASESTVNRWTSAGRAARMAWAMYR